MYCEVFIKDFTRLGQIAAKELEESPSFSSLGKAMLLSFDANPMFTLEMQNVAIKSILKEMLTRTALQRWIEPYRESIRVRDEVAGILMAGNIPLVGFHDFLSCLAAGCRAEVKLSSRDGFLLPALVEILCEINPFWKHRIQFVNSLSEGITKLIAAGSDQTVRSVGGNFRETPSLLRGTRSSFAILDGSESKEMLDKLCDDMFLYYGMGCRSVSTLIVPPEYNFEPLLNAAVRYEYLGSNPDFSASCRYSRAVLQMENLSFIDGKFFLLQKGAAFPPPLAVIGVREYNSLDDIYSFIKTNEEHIQAKVSALEIQGFIKPGDAQHPQLEEYADNINTLDFLMQNI